MRASCIASISTTGEEPGSHLISIIWGGTARGQVLGRKEVICEDLDTLTLSLWLSKDKI